MRTWILKNPSFFYTSEMSNVLQGIWICSMPQLHNHKWDSMYDCPILRFQFELNNEYRARWKISKIFTHYIFVNNKRDLKAIWDVFLEVIIYFYNMSIWHFHIITKFQQAILTAQYERIKINVFLDVYIKRWFDYVIIAWKIFNWNLSNNGI